MVMVRFTFYVYYVFSKPTAFSLCITIVSHYKRQSNKVSDLKIHRQFCSHCHTKHHWHSLVFFGHRPKCFWNDRKELSHFGWNVWKYRLKTLLWRVLIQLWDKWPKCLSEKKTGHSRCKCISYATMMVLLEWQTQRLIQTASYLVDP